MKYGEAAVAACARRQEEWLTGLLKFEKLNYAVVKRVECVYVCTRDRWIKTALVRA